MKSTSCRSTILSLLVAPVLTFVSVPFWEADIRYENPVDPNGFSAFALAFALMITAFAGAIAGVVCGVVAQRRRERLLPVRVFAFMANLIMVGFGIYEVWTWPGGIHVAR